MNKNNQAIDTKLNFITGLILMFSSMFSSFVVPRIIIESFGSDVNGLVSSISQYIGYASLLEGGITGIIIPKLYKPLIENDQEKISIILNTARRFYRKISLSVTIYCTIVAILFPLLFSKGFNKEYIFILVVVISLQYIIQYGFSLTLNTLISADGKIFITSLTQTAINVFSVFILYFVINRFPSIHIFRLIVSLLYFIQPIVYLIYVKKNYDIKKTNLYDENLVKNKWDGIALNIATFVRYSTDVAILTALTDYKTVSIYSTYYLVISGLEAIIQIMTNSITPIMGKKYTKNNIIEFNSFFDKYESLVLTIIFTIFTVAFLMITPFVKLYTARITDANYYQPVFGYLLVISEVLFLIKRPQEDLAMVAERFKEMKYPSYIEAITNIVLSIIFTKLLGLIGVALGTIVAMMIRVYLQINISNNILSRNSFVFLKKILVFFIASSIMVVIALKLIPSSFTIVSWIAISALLFLIVVTLNCSLSNIVFKLKFKDILELLN